MHQLDALEAVTAGRLSLAEAAKALGRTPAEVERQLEVLQLAQALSARESRRVRASVLRGVVGLGLVGALGLLLLNRTAWAAGTCAQTLPAPLVTLCPDEPALASEVNGNFASLASALTNKTGGLSGTGVTTAGDLSARNLTLSGTADFTASSTLQAIRLASASYGMGVQNSTAYFRTAGSFSWFLNGTHVGANVDDPGAGGTRLMRLDNTGNLTVTTINSRRPSFVASATCNSSSCSASCSPGVIKSGFGFHGYAFNTTNDSQTGVCGKQYQWMGACIGQTTCQVITGCPTSSIWLDCW